VSITLATDFCVEALEEALARFGKPEIFNTDQGSQFTSTEFTSVLQREKIAISMDGKGCWRDNVFLERLWRSVKYEEVYLHAYASVPEARSGIRSIFRLLQCGEAALEPWLQDTRPDILQPAASRSGMINRPAVHLTSPRGCADKPSHLSPDQIDGD
jgi:transposase InsO family protein